MKKLRQIYLESVFRPSLLGLLFNPAYLVRTELYKAIKRHSSKARGELLDFGCGSKPYESLFTGVAHYIGCDIHVSGHSHKDSRVDYFYNGKELPFKDSEFDWVVSFETFEHIFNLNEILSELARVIRSGGHMLVTAPFCWDEHEIPYDFARYTSYGLTHLLESHGFTIIDYEKTGNYLLCSVQILQMYIFLHLLPRQKLLRLALTPFFVAPLTVLGLAASFVFPKQKDCFLNSVVLCVRK